MILSGRNELVFRHNDARKNKFNNLCLWFHAAGCSVSPSQMFLCAVAVATGCHTVMLLTQLKLFCWNSTIKEWKCRADVFNVIRLDQEKPCQGAFILDRGKHLSWRTRLGEGLEARLSLTFVNISHVVSPAGLGDGHGHPSDAEQAQHIRGRGLQ